MATEKNIPVYDDVEDLVDLRGVWSGLRRRAGLFAAVTATIFSFVIAFVVFSTELYTAETSLMIEPKTEVFAYGQDVFPQVAADPQLVDTEVELLRSRAMANRVAHRVEAAHAGDLIAQNADGGDAPNFFEQRLSDVAADLASLRNRNTTTPALPDDEEAGEKITVDAEAEESARAMIAAAEAGADAVPTADELEALDAERLSPANFLPSADEGVDDGVAEAAAARTSAQIDDILSRLEIQRVGATFLIKIRYSSPDADEAAAVANIYAEEYILEQLEAQYAALRQANQWIDARLQVLRQEVRSAEQAAATYRAENNLVEAVGSSISEKAMAGIATELAAARTNLASTRARYNTVRGIVNTNAPLETISEVMSSPIVADLRRQQTEINRKRAELNVRYGPRHPEVLKVNEEAAELQGQIGREVRRIVDSLGAEVGFAQAQVASLERSMAEARGDLAADDTASVKLLELERDLEATRGVYEALLNRQKELNERDQLADANARIIARAEAPEAAVQAAEEASSRRRSCARAAAWRGDVFRRRSARYAHQEHP